MNRVHETNVIKNSLGQSHDIVRRLVREGDTVIDATAGNGGDTVFLAKLVGCEGRVYSFDIQQGALDATLQKLRVEGIDDRVILVHDSHHNMDKHVKGKVRTVMFNLGYLPGGDHNIGTRGDTTSEALNKSMQLLEVGGLISVVVYYGGDSGFEEKDFILEFIRNIDHKQFTVMKTEFVNQINCPPILICIEKLF